MNVRLVVAGTALLGAAAAGWGGAPVFACLTVATVAWCVALSSCARASLGLVLAVALVGRLLLAPTTYRTDDLHRYAWEGRVQNAGFSPYAIAPDDPRLAHLRDESFARVNHPEHAAIYPPGAQLVFRAATAAGLREEGLRALFLLLEACIVLVLCRWLRAAGKPVGWAIVYAWSPLPALSAASGHLEPLALLPLAGAGLAWTLARPNWAAALVGLAASAKLFPLLLLPWLFARRPRSLVVGFLPVAALAVLPFVGQGDWIGPLLHFGREFRFNGPLHAGLDALGPGTGRAVAAVVLALLAVAIARSSLRFAAAAALATLGLLILSPTVHYWYLSWILLPLAVTGPKPVNLPVLAWCAAALALFPTYRAAHAGSAFVELPWVVWIEYGVPVAVLVAVIVAHRPSRRPLAVPAPNEAPTGTFAVIIPARGEVLNLLELLPRWLESGAERIVVADSPTGDGTRELVRGDPRLVYLAVERRGYGAAVLAGMHAAGPVDWFVVSDADHESGPTTVRALLAPFRDDRVGLVSAVRSGSRPLRTMQRFGNELVAQCIGWRFGRRYHDLGPFRALRRTMWPAGSIRDHAFGINVEMNVRALQRGIEVVEVELPNTARRHGRDRISGTWRGVFFAGKGMVSRFLTASLDGRRATVVVLAKVPGALPVKTRLVPALGEAGAREAHLDMLRETVGRARVLDPKPTIAFSPADADARAALPGLGACHYLPLTGRSAIACLEEALAAAWDDRPLIALGADSPDLPIESLEEAARVARRGGAALVPTLDGGFACLALPRPVAGLSEAFDYGSQNACDALTAFLQRAGLEVTRLGAWQDVDTIEDLEAWHRRRAPVSRADVVDSA